MKISLNWLNDYIDITDLSEQQLAATLTGIGLEVEAIDKIEPVQGQVVVGQIMTAEKHPNADSLQVCQVDIGSGTPLNIVCGAPNARAGIRVAVATVGSCLPGDFKIKATKIRGTPSEGMLCSEKELGLSEEHAGIIELPATHALGAAITGIYGFNDTVFTLNVTPNRADCLGYLGVARDLAAKLQRPLKANSEWRGFRTAAVSNSKTIDIHIDDAGCGRFCAMPIDDVANGASPYWLRQRLSATGMRPISHIVDVTNYVMLEYGQPIHAYDQRDIAGGKIGVRMAKTGETMQTLDGTTLNLQAGDLLISDAQRPVGLAGIMGGANSEIKADTKDVIIEVAHFSPVLIRKTAKRLGLHTEASHRFERGTDISSIDIVIQRVAGLLGGKTSAFKDVYPQPVTPGRIAVRIERVHEILGLKSIAVDDAIGALTRLGFTLEDKTDVRMLFQIPGWRGDIMREIDLIEEIGRIIGFEKIPYTYAPMREGPSPEDRYIDHLENSRTVMANLGFSETISFPFVGQSDITAFRLSKPHPYAALVEVANPLAEDQAFMQPSLVMNLVKAVANNRRHGIKGARLFELGRGFLDFRGWNFDQPLFVDLYAALTRPGRHLGERARQDVRPVERQWLSAIIDQPYQPKGWNIAETAADFFHGRHYLDAFLKSCGLTEANYQVVTKDKWPFLHPARAASISINNTWIGVVGELHPATAQAWDLDDKGHAPVILEIDIEAVFACRGGARKIIANVEKFPPSTRDLAIIVNKNLTNAEIISAFRQFPQKRNLQNIQLFDVYEGSNLPEEKKSLAYSLTFQSAKRTLNDKEVDMEIDLLLKWLQEKLQAQRR